MRESPHLRGQLILADQTARLQRKADNVVLQRTQRVITARLPWETLSQIQTLSPPVLLPSTSIQKRAALVKNQYFDSILPFAQKSPAKILRLPDLLSSIQVL